MATSIKIRQVAISTFLFCFLGFVSAFYVRPQVVVFSIHPSHTVTCEGCRVELSCQFPWQQTVGETPDPQLEWEINGTNIRKIFSDVQVRNSQGHMRLIIPTAHPRHGGLYRCVVRDGNNSSGCQTTPCIPTVTVSREAIVQVIGHSVAMVTVNASRCRTTVLPCGSEILAAGSNRPGVRWFQNGVPVGNTTNEVLSSGDLLLFWSSEAGDGGSRDRGSGDGGVGRIYECVATFSSGTNITMATFQVELDSEREEPQNDIITGHQTMIEGSTAEMVCSLCAKDVTWWKAEDVPNGRQAVSNATFLIGGHVLRLGSLHIRDSGQYCCHGNNTEGTVQQACTQLEVLRTTEPRITSSQHRSTIFKSRVDREEENIEIDCSTADTEVQPTTRTWFHNGKKLNVSDTTTTLVVSSTGTNDSTELHGVYQCFVSNAAGWSGLVTRLLPPYLTNPPGRPSYTELPRPVERYYNAWFLVSWAPPLYTANVSSVQYRVYYLPNIRAIDTPANTTEVLAAAPGRLISEVAVINPNKEVISERGPVGRSESLHPRHFQCTNKTLFPPNVSLACEGGRLIVSWVNNPKNAQFYQGIRVNNYVISGNCSYPNGAVLKINNTFYWGNSAENGQLLPAGTECSFQGAARPYRRLFEDRYCYRLDLIAYSDPQLCHITAAVKFEQEQYAVNESENVVQLCVIMEGFGVAVNLSTVSLTAQAGEDYYVQSPLELTITSEADNRQCVNITIMDDGKVEMVESFMIILQSSNSYVVLNPEVYNATISIIDNSTVTIGFEQEVYTVHEDASTVSVCAVVSEGELEREVEMVVTTQSNNAAAGTDFKPLSQMVTFNHTTHRQCLEIEIMEDTILEDSESFYVSLTTSDPVVVVYSETSTVWIIDTNNVTISFEQAVYTVHEDDKVSVCAAVLDSGLERNVEITVTTQSNNAAAGDDFSPLPQRQTLTFNATTRRQCIEVKILEDDVVERNETLSFSLTTSNPVVRIDNESSAVIIVDNDDVTIGFEQEVYTVREDAGSLPVCAVLLEGSRELEREVEVIIRLLSETTATDGVDFTFTQKLTFNASTERPCVQVEILEDAIIETNETIFLVLTSSDPAVKFSDAAHRTTVWIVDATTPTIEPSLTAAVVSVAIVILLSLIVTVLAVCLWQLKNRDKRRFLFPAYPIDEVVDEHYMPVSLDTHTNDEDTKSIITVYHELYPDKKMAIETASLNLDQTPRRNSESSSLLPLPFPFHLEVPQTLNEVNDTKHAIGRRNSNSSSCSTQQYIHFDKLLDVSSAPPYKNVFQTSGSSFSSVHPIHEEQTITDGVPQSVDLAVVKTAGGEDGETDEGIGRHSLSLTSSSSSSCEHIKKSPQADPIAEAEADPETSDTGISIADSTRGSGRQCAAERHHGTGPKPDSHKAVNSSTDLASETPLVTTEPDLQDGIMNLPPAAEPEELTRFAPVSDSGFGDFTEDYFAAH